jgi:hypothetical protein
MFKVTAASPGSPVVSGLRQHRYKGALIGREHAIDRVAKLGAVTVVRGAAPAEAEFAGRRARVLIAQFGLGDHGPASAGVGSCPSASFAPAAVARSSEDAFAAAVAYRHTPFDRRNKSALRFVELA